MVTDHIPLGDPSVYYTHILKSDIFGISRNESYKYCNIPVKFDVVSQYLNVQSTTYNNAGASTQ